MKCVGIIIDESTVPMLEQITVPDCDRAFLFYPFGFSKGFRFYQKVYAAGPKECTFDYLDILRMETSDRDYLEANGFDLSCYSKETICRDKTKKRNDFIARLLRLFMK